jgi:hypothetical protein
MIRFRIVGSGYLELPSDFSFSFNYNNGIFAFDSMQLSRSGEFSIPRTPANDLLLDFSHNPSSDGTFIRKKKQAELHYSGGKIDGYLFIGKYTGGTYSGSYSAVFVYGELSGLKSISEKGSIGTYLNLNLTDSVYVDPTSIVSAYNSSGILPDTFKLYNYRNLIQDVNKLTNAINMLPTVKLSYLMSSAATALNINVDTTGLGIGREAVGLILSGNKASPSLTTVNVSGITKTSSANPLNFSGGSTFFELTTRNFKYKHKTAIGWYTTENVTVNVLRCKADLTILFETAYYDFACVTGIGDTFLSDGSFEGWFRNIYPNTTIDLKKGDYFTFTNKNDYDIFNGRPTDDYDEMINLSFKVYSGDVNTVDVSETLYLRDNLPDVSLLDLVKIFANLFRCGVQYAASTNTISFFNFEFDKSTAEKLDDVLIEIKSVDRTFLNYARRNVVKFNNEDYVDREHNVEYMIDNDSLSDEKTLFTIPFSEGNANFSKSVVVNDFELASPYKKTAKKQTICVASNTAGVNYLMHISMLYENFDISEKLKDIIFNSTTVVMSVKMTAGDFLKIGNTKVFSYRGKHYCCIFGTHSGQIAELTLIKI